jgi:sugar-specific transcriptional regulator TrmB
MTFRTGNPAPVRHLVALGLTPLEARAYAALLSLGPSTGYGIAKAIGSPVANTYKAVESLCSKGAAMAEAADGEGGRFAAVAANEFLGGVRARFERHRKGASRDLRGLPRASLDDRVYRLADKTQVLERCRAMLRRAGDIVLIDAFSGPLEELRAPIEHAARRGVRVAVLAYEPIVIQGAFVVVYFHKPRSTRERWAGEWINVVADSAEFVMAYLGRGSAVRHATWSASAFLAHVLYSGILGELGHSALRHAIADGAPPRGVTAVLRKVDRYRVLRTAGRRALMQSGP